ncbi:MAG TPA: gamma-glutamyltransferase [Nakamurella sp.]|nr:gamma-glutamyltransferase [Nakamurella sp.]
MAPLPAGVAAGHPDPARAGRDILLAGGSAADAAVAMVLTGCAAETIFCGLAGGGFATVYQAGTGSVHCLDFFVAVPGLDGILAGPPRDIAVQFGDVAVPYAVGGATVAVPGVPRGTFEVHRRFGRLPWREVVSPAVQVAGRGAALPEQHAALLADVAAAMLLSDGVQAYSRPEPAGQRLLRAGELLLHPGLADTMALLGEEGPEPLMTGPVGQAVVAAARADGGALSPADMRAYRVTELPAASARLGPGTVRVRGNDLDHLVATIEALDASAVAAGGPAAALALVDALRAGVRRAGTTSVVAVDGDGNACAITHSLGLGSGIWARGVHGNSMLGEGELLRGELVPGSRMGSMMVPLVVTGGRGELLLAGGAAGGSRIRPALVQVLAAMLLCGRTAAAAVAAPRLSAADDAVHLEPGFDEDTVTALRAAGNAVVLWPEQRPYFGGVSVAGPDGPAADPRRGGAAFRLDSPHSFES